MLITLLTSARVLIKTPGLDYKSGLSCNTHTHTHIHIQAHKGKREEKRRSRTGRKPPACIRTTSIRFAPPFAPFGGGSGNRGWECTLVHARITEWERQQEKEGKMSLKLSQALLIVNWTDNGPDTLPRGEKLFV